MQNCTIRKAAAADLPVLLDILNYYSIQTLADFSDKQHTLADIQALVDTEERLPKYAAEVNGEVIGFAVAYPFRPEQTFANTVKFTYWLRPSFTGQGIGTKLYNQMEAECRQNGVATLLVNVSSENKGSINFHERLGFTICGHFKQVAHKQGKIFDMIWLQKHLE